MQGNFTPLVLIKVVLIVTLVVTTLSVFLLTFLYIFYQRVFTTYLLYLPLSEFSLFFDVAKLFTNTAAATSHFSLDGFGLVLLNLAVMVGLISLLSLDSRFYWKNASFIFLCHLLIVVIFLFSLINDIIGFFILYEGLLIPSFLLVYFVSPYRKAVQASLYFVI